MSRFVQNQTQVAGARYDEGLRAYFLQIYNYMATGLALTGAVAFFVASVPALFNAIFGTPLVYLVMFAPLGVVFFLSARSNSLSYSSAQLWFWVFASLMGLSMASIFAVYTGESIARVFFITGATFAGMSLYGYTTKTDLSRMGSFLMMAVMGLVIASIVNVFLRSSGFQFLLSAVAVLVFTGLTAYDTQALKESYQENLDSEMAGKSAIFGALTLYLDFINMFTSLLHLLGERK